VATSLLLPILAVTALAPFRVYSEFAVYEERLVPIYGLDKTKSESEVSRSIVHEGEQHIDIPLTVTHFLMLAKLNDSSSRLTSAVS